MISTDGCIAVMYYLSGSFEKAQVITAKSAAVNLARPTDDDGKLGRMITEKFNSAIPRDLLCSFLTNIPIELYCRHC